MEGYRLPFRRLTGTREIQDLMERPSAQRHSRPGRRTAKKRVSEKADERRLRIDERYKERHRAKLRRKNTHKRKRVIWEMPLSRTPSSGDEQMHLPQGNSSLYKILPQRNSRLKNIKRSLDRWDNKKICISERQILDFKNQTSMKSDRDNEEDLKNFIPLDFLEEIQDL
mmetsp:Transcript_27568/g.44864  ORF Transcript_27568/g.44864 Transcript_27568/m.44864 type:complete len:169 (-) Transcript_27568:102-608(-)